MKQVAVNMASAISLLTFITLSSISGAWAEGHAHAGQCKPDTAGCVSNEGQSHMKCAHGWCDPNTDAAGWGCCKTRGGRVGCAVDYPWMCDIKVEIESYGAPADGTTACESPSMASDAHYNTHCDYPCWESPATCTEKYNVSVTAGRFTCGYVGTCNPWMPGCKTASAWGESTWNASAAVWQAAGGHSPMRCGDGSTCDAAVDGWQCCATRGKRASCAPDYPIMCKNMVPIASYSDGSITEDGTASQCVMGSQEWDWCDHPCWDEVSKCDQYGDGGIVDGALECAYYGESYHTCGELKAAYKEAECCGMGAKDLPHALHT